MRGFGFLGFVFLLLLVGAVGIVAFNMGISTGAAGSAAVDGATVVYAPWTGASPFGLILALFVVIVVIGLIGRAFAGPRMHHGHRRWGYGHTGWGYGKWGSHGELDEAEALEPFRPMLDRWHRRAHGEGGGAFGPPAGPAGQPGQPGQAGPGRTPSR